MIAIGATGTLTGEVLAEPGWELPTQLAGAPIRLFTPYWPRVPE
jgi:hypothetical protein